MNKIKSDIEIARAADIKPIVEVLKKSNVPDDPFAFSPMGRHIAKLNLEYIDLLLKKKKFNISYCNNTYTSWRRKNNYFCWFKRWSK